MDKETLRWVQRLNNYRKALTRLAEIVREGSQRKLNSFERDAIVKRFEFTFECAWRLMKSYAENQGEEEIGASRDSIRRAFKLHLIEDGETWLEMIKWRNETSRNYDGEIADTAIDLVVERFYPLLVAFCARMEHLASGLSAGLFEQKQGLCGD